MNDMIPADMLPYLQTAGRALGGVLLIFLGFSFAYKCYQASFMGKIHYWGGLEKAHWFFIPMTMLLTPFFVHCNKPTDRNLIKTRTAGYVHLIWGPLFFMLSLMLIVSGSDFLGLPGTALMNYVLTAGNRPGIPQAITYQPPFTYKFPIFKKARRAVAKLLTADIYIDKKKKLNPFDDSKRIKLWEEDDEDRAEDEKDRLKAEQDEAQKALAASQAQAAREQAAKAQNQPKK